jgi:hypothetical protein
VTWTSTPVALNQPFTVTVQGTSKANGMPLDRIMGQDVGRVGLSRVEPYVPCDVQHLAPTSDLEAPVTQIGPGTYTIGPLVFDEAGRWVMRFHLYEDCITSPVTPHAHIAFFVDVK